MRTSRPVRLTPEGDHVLDLARPLLDAHDVGLKRLHRGEVGVLTVATLPSCAATLLPPLVSPFLEEHPGSRS